MTYVRQADAVAVAFADNSLGGVSRSALSAGKIWRALGYKVIFIPYVGVHPHREAKFREVGAIAVKAVDAPWTTLAAVHLHHGAVNARTKAQIAALVEAANGRPVPLMTKNVFAVNDRVLNAWPGPRSATVPGRWTVLQYNFNCGVLSQRRRPAIIPNVQDSEFFRPPSEEERIAARARLDVTPSDRVVLRVGSPIRGKWSKSYIKLATACGARGFRLILLGAPPSLERAIREIPNDKTLFIEPTSDDSEIRALYWASDVFALDAARGETFGNVAFEALLSGTPVVYRSREWRDNTLWEVSHLPEFHYAQSEKSWIASIGTTAARQGRTSEMTRAALIESYGYESVLSTYAAVLRRLIESPPGRVEWTDDSWAKGLSGKQRAKAFLNHNPLVTLVKEQKLILLEKRSVMQRVR